MVRRESRVGWRHEARVLEGIDKVPWYRLTHCRGVAADVPAMLKDLTSDDRDVWGEAVYDGLFDKLCHQYTLYPATPYTIPFLIDLVREGHLKAKPALPHVFVFLLLCAEHDESGVYWVISWFVNRCVLLFRLPPSFDFLLPLPRRPRMRQLIVAAKDVFSGHTEDGEVEVRRIALRLVEYCGACK